MKNSPAALKPASTCNDEQNTSSALLNAAEELFHRKGYEAVSTREIAQRAGVNLAAIRYHFGSKESLFHAVVKKLMEKSIAFRELLDAARPFTPENCPTDKAVSLLMHFIEQFMLKALSEDEPQGCRLMLREAASTSQARKDMVTQLVADTSKEFIKPLLNDLTALIDLLHVHAQSTNKTGDSFKLDSMLCAQSILGQCFFYASHKPFIEYIRDSNLSAEQEIHTIAQHITHFSLLAIGFNYEYFSK